MKDPVAPIILILICVIFLVLAPSDCYEDPQAKEVYKQCVFDDKLNCREKEDILIRECIAKKENKK